MRVTGWPCLWVLPAPCQHLVVGMLHRWDDSQKYLSDNAHLVCEETANYLVIWCIDLEVEEVSGAGPGLGKGSTLRLPLGDTVLILLGQKCALMEQVAHQTIVMQFILELAKSLKVDPRACFRQFFTKIKVGALSSWGEVGVVLREPGYGHWWEANTCPLGPRSL